MLSPSDAQVAAADPDLVGLPILLEPPLLLERLRQQLGGVTLRQIRGGYLRYKPKTNCLASYQLDTDLGEIEIYAKAYTARDAAKLGKIEQRRSTSTLGPGEIHLDDAAIGVFIFPNDAVLEYLRMLVNDGELQHLVQRLLGPMEDAGRYSVQRLAYKPERRYVGLLRLDGQPRAVVRFYTEEDFARANHNAKVLRSGKTMRLARRLGRSRRHAVTALEWLSGGLLREQLAQGPPDLGCIRRVGRALAELHATDSQKLQSRSRRMEVEGIQQSVEFGATICPELSGELAELADAVACYLLERPEQEDSVHGDLYGQQILLQEDGVALLDLDEAHRGDGTADIGNFLAHLWRESPGRLDQIREALLDGYAAGGLAIDIDHVQRYTAAALLRLIPEPFRRRERDWPEKMRGILTAAQDSFARQAIVRRSHPGALSTDVSVHHPFGVAGDAAMPILAAAIDPTTVSTLLATHLPWPARLLTLRVIRYKPHRRCLIAYDIERTGSHSALLTLIGKIRAKGLDERTFQLQRELWDSGFDDASADEISVPQPIALIPPLRMWLQRRVRGVPCIDLLTTDSATTLPSRLADAIFKLHQCRIAPQRSHTIHDELRLLHERLPEVSQRHPQLKERLQRLLEHCSRIAESIDAPRTSPIHRDFYHDQVLVDGNRLYLLDFDLFAEGDPALDIGNFIAHLSEHALRKLDNPNALAAQEAAMIDRYLQLAGHDLRPRIRIYSALALARHIYISTLFEDRSPFTQSILTLAEGRIAEIG